MAPSRAWRFVPDLLQPSMTAWCLQGFLKVERQVVGWFRCEQNDHFQQNLFPVFIILDDQEDGCALSQHDLPCCYCFRAVSCLAAHRTEVFRWP